jgi:hypothetical protein
MKKLFFDNSKNEKRLIELETKIKELEYTINYPPKYKVGQVTEDGTKIISVGKCYEPVIYPKQSPIWEWYYVGVKDNQIINFK